MSGRTDEGNMMGADMVAVEASGKFTEFSLLGGPLYRLGRRLGLVRGGTNTLPLGVALGLLLWVILAALALFEGVSSRLFSLSVIGVHVRLLVAIPLFFLCESLVGPRFTAFVETIVRSKVVPDRALPALNTEVARIRRWQTSLLPETICLGAAALFSTLASQMHLTGTTGAFHPGRLATGISMADLWFWIVCLPIFRFLLIRWIWRLGLWSYFLYRVAKLDLDLIPTHPDGAAGLGYLEVVQIHFMPLVLAISAIQAGSLAEELASGALSFEGIYPAVALLLIVDALLFLGPAFIFARRLWACRVKGLSDYMEFASSYVSGFDTKWLKAGTAPGEPLLGTSDLQSLADLTNSMNIVRNMRCVPLSARLLAGFGITAVLPILPLLLFKYPIAELAEKFLTRLTGL